jgi:tetratricopeptide (TPR) repeat protein
MLDWFYRNRSKRQAHIGHYLFARHEWELAIASYDRALKMWPGNAAAYLKRGWAYRELLRHKEAEADASSYLATAAPGSPQYRAAAFNLRAQARLSLDDAPSALADIRAAIELHPHSNYFIVQAAILIGLKDRLEVLASLKRAVELGPDNVEALFPMARILCTSSREHERDGKQALALARRLCELTSWKDWRAQSILAAAYAECGEFPNAVLWAENALQSAPLDEKQSRQFRVAQYRLQQPYRDDFPFSFGNNASIPSSSSTESPTSEST